MMLEIPQEMLNQGAKAAWGDLEKKAGDTMDSMPNGTPSNM